MDNISPGKAMATVLAALVLGLSAPGAAEFNVDGMIESGFFGAPTGWEIKGFRVVEGRYLSRKGAEGRVGTASTEFQGPDGFYKIRIKYLDEGDGVSRAELKVGDRKVGHWQFDGILVNRHRWQEFDGVKINKGDRITLRGTQQHYEYCRLVGMEILPSEENVRVAAARQPVPEIEYSRDLVPLAKYLDVKGGTEYIPPIDPPFTRGATTYLLYLEKGQRFTLISWPIYTGFNSSIDYTLRRPGAEQPVSSGSHTGSTANPIRLRLAAPETGIYELAVDSAPGMRKTVQVRFDVPGVRRPPVAERGFFFVPRGTEAVGVKMNGHAVLLDAASRVLLDHWAGGKKRLRVDVPEGSDGQLWFFQGQLKELAGVPPYVCRRPEAMLIPAELVRQQ